MTRKTWIRSVLAVFGAVALMTATGCGGTSSESSGQTSSKVDGACAEESDDGAADKVDCSIDTDCDSDEVCMNGRCTGLDGDVEDADECEGAGGDADAAQDDDVDDVDDADDEGGADKVVCAKDTDCDADERCVDGKCD